MSLSEKPPACLSSLRRHAQRIHQLVLERTQISEERRDLRLHRHLRFHRSHRPPDQANRERERVGLEFQYVTVGGFKGFRVHSGGNLGDHWEYWEMSGG